MGLQQSNILFSGLFQDAPVGFSAVTLTYTSGSGTIIIPSNVTQFTAICIGGGAAGWGGGIDNTGYGGGGGGGLGMSTINTAQSGFTFYYSVGAGGNGLTNTSQGPLKLGGNSVLSSSTYATLVRGSGGGTTTASYTQVTNAVPGGDTSFGDLPNVGQIIYDGGSGALGTGAVPTKKTGGGGSGAGTTGAGNNGSQSDGNRGVGAGGAAKTLYGGKGGNSYPVDTELGWQYGDGSPGSSYGGGGGGGASNGVSQVGYGGNGAPGIIIISYNLPNY